MDFRVGACRHLACNMDLTWGDEGFDRNMRRWVFGEEAVEDRIGNLVAHLVRVPARHRFGGEQSHGGFVRLCHGHRL